MDMGRDQPRKEKLEANKQINRTYFERTPQSNRMNHTTSSKDNEYIGSSHPSILARGTGTTAFHRSRYGSQARSKRDSDDRRPCTPVPSLISSDTMSPPSTSTISPTTPVFDVALSRPSMSRPSHNRNPTPLDFDKISQKNTQGLPKLRTAQHDFDPASTYQPRRTIPINPSVHSTSHSTNTASTEETSFIEWDDDDSSRLQRMKQSLNFARSHRSNKPTPIQSKNPDKQLNAIPRVQRSPRSPQPTSPTYTYTPQPRSPTYDTTQQRPFPICVPASSGQARYLPSIIPPQPVQPMQPPPIRHPEHNRPVPQHISTSASHPQYIRQNLPPPLIRPSYTSQVQSMKYPNYTVQGQYQHQHHFPTKHEEEHITTNENAASKPNRFRKIMRGVAERVSMRDLRKEASASARK